MKRDKNIINGPKSDEGEKHTEDVEDEKKKVD